MSKILIDEKEYAKLLKANCELNILMAGGVDMNGVLKKTCPVGVKNN